MVESQRNLNKPYSSQLLSPGQDKLIASSQLNHLLNLGYQVTGSKSKIFVNLTQIINLVKSCLKLEVSHSFDESLVLT
jgi:uncharacterized UBP type Zn finger protein